MKQLLNEVKAVVDSFRNSVHMKIEKDMIIQATVIEEVGDFLIKLLYEGDQGLMFKEDLDWVVAPRLEDYVKNGNLLKVKVTRVKIRNDEPFFEASAKILKVPPRCKAVGYWSLSYPSSCQLPDVQQLPHPSKLVDASWHVNERDKITEYLRSGWTHSHWRGLSFCRFNCGALRQDMGSKCLTDGEWIWPEGLAHYIEKHDVQLPEEFITTMDLYEWNCCNRYKEGYQVPKGEYDYSYWIKWSSQFK